MYSVAMDTTSTQQLKVIASAIVALLILGGGLWFVLGKAPAGTGASATSTAATSTTATTTVNGVTGTGSFTVSGDDVVDLTPPDFRAPIRFSAGTSADVRAAINARDAQIVSTLEKNTFDLGAWIDLGTIRKMAGDYKGAETAWLFVAKAAPNNSVAYNNLGDLYMNFLPDYPKAEAMYLKTIAIDKTLVGSYETLATLYEHFYKIQTTAAEDILKKGIAANPTSVDLKATLARYYTSQKMTDKAKAEYQAAIDTANAQGQTDLAASLKAEAGL